MDIGFLHIGMMKTASTYMQSVWFEDDSYCLSKKGTFKFVNQLRSAVKKDNLEEVTANISKDPNQELGQEIVISNEGLSLAYINDINFQHKIPQFIDYSSQILGNLSAAKTENLLIVVREPISWIKSIFNQFLKQGGSGSAQRFVDTNFRLLTHAFNLEFIVNSYRRYFNNILLIPFEILKDNEDQFWNIISEKFEVPIPKKRLTSKPNKSFGLERLFILSKLNEMSSILLNTLIDSKNYKRMYRQEKDELLKQYSHSSQWVPRRFVKFANKKQLDEIYSLFNISKIPEDFLKFDLSANLIETIKSKYIDFLRDNIDSEYVDFYEQKLQTHVSKQSSSKT